jgi:hypothetical protein
MYLIVCSISEEYESVFPLPLFFPPYPLKLDRLLASDVEYVGVVNGFCKFRHRFLAFLWSPYRSIISRQVTNKQKIWEYRQTCIFWQKIMYFDTFDGAKPRFLNRGKKRRSVSTLTIPRASDRGVE